MENVNPYKAPASDISATPQILEYDQTGPISPKGRFERLSYLAWSGIIGLAAAFIAGISTTGMVGSGVVQAEQMPFISIAINLAAFVLVVPIVIQRFHDINASAWWSLTLFIPIVYLVPMLILLLKRGIDGSNRFGPPRETRGREKNPGDNLPYRLAHRHHCRDRNSRLPGLC